jgi:hypothetical protein
MRDEPANATLGRHYAAKAGSIEPRSPWKPKSSHPVRRAKHLPTFTLEKLVPGGIAEVSPWRSRVAEGKDVLRWPRRSTLWADREKPAI